MKIKTLQKAKKLEQEITLISNSLKGIEYLLSDDVVERPITVSFLGGASSVVLPESICKDLARVISNKLKGQLCKLNDELEEL